MTYELSATAAAKGWKKRRPLKLQIDEHEWNVLWKTCLIVLVACTLLRLPLLVSPGWSVDSYSIWTDGTMSTEQALAQGRPAGLLLGKFFQSLGGYSISVSSLLQPLGFMAFAFFSPLFFFSMFEISKRTLMPVACASIFFVLHPYLLEILTFPEASFYANASTALGAIIIFLAMRSKSSVLWLSFLSIFALSMYQLVANYLLVALAFSFLSLSHMPGWRRSTFGRLLSVTMLSVLGYYVFVKVILIFSGFNITGRGQTLRVDQIPQRVTEAINLFTEIAKVDLIIPAKGGRIAVAAIAMLGLATMFASCRNAGQLAKLTLILPAAAVASVGIVLLGSTWWPVPRVLGACAYVLAWLLLFAFLGIPWFSTRIWQPHVRTAAMVASFVAILSFAFIGMTVHREQLQVNTWDRTLARGIAARVSEVAPAGSRKLTIVNSHMRWAHQRGLSSLRGDMNMSAFFVPSAIPGLMTEATGRTFEFQTPSPTAIQQCTQAAPWPSPAATWSENDVVVICL